MGADRTHVAGWEILDRGTVADIRTRGGDTSSLGVSEDRIKGRVDELSTLATNGNIAALQNVLDGHRQWAAQCGLRRIENALIELDRVIAGPARGQAVLQAQALVRFIVRHLADDVAALEAAVQQP